MRITKRRRRRIRQKAYLCGPGVKHTRKEIRARIEEITHPLPTRKNGWIPLGTCRMTYSGTLGDRDRSSWRVVTHTPARQDTFW